MSDWKLRAKIQADVVFFQYASEAVESEAREVYVWDLDKTYLDTQFESIRGLIKVAMEKAFQKRNVPGTATLVRALRNSWQLSHHGRADFPIYFITGSPPQLEKRIHEKLNLDGIYPYGMFCKDNLRNLRPSRLWRLTHQVGFKLQSLLQLRIHLGPDVRQVLWGDDSESDAVIYSLYSDICARRFDEGEIRNILGRFKVVGDQVDSILRLQGEIPEHDPVEKIYINLADDTDADYYLKFGRRILPIYNSFQTSLDLFQDGRLNGDQVTRVAQDLIDNFRFTKEELEKSLDDMIRRPTLSLEAFLAIQPILIEAGLLRESFKPSIEPKSATSTVKGRVFELEGSYEPWVPKQIDYYHDYR